MPSYPSSSSLPSITNDLLPLSPSELSDMTLDNRMVTPLNDVFDNDNPDAAHLRHYSYISLNIERLKNELDRHDEERRELFDHMRNSEDFQSRIQPVLNDYRRLTRRSGFSPQANQPNAKKLRRPSTPYRPFPPSSKTSSKGSSRSARSFLSAGSSSDNPIDVDNLKTVKKPRFDPQIFEIREGQRHPTSNKGHLTKTFETSCKRCGQSGHVKADCDTKIRSFNHCDTCEWLDRPQRLCEHYDVSPVDLKTLLGDKIPYDYSD